MSTFTNINWLWHTYRLLIPAINWWPKPPPASPLSSLKPSFYACWFLMAYVYTYKVWQPFFYKGEKLCRIVFAFLASELLQQGLILTLKQSTKQKLQLRTLNFLLLSFKENKAWCFMWILCLAEDSHETSSLIFSEKQWMLSAQSWRAKEKNLLCR